MWPCMKTAPVGPVNSHPCSMHVVGNICLPPPNILMPKGGINMKKRGQRVKIQPPLVVSSFTEMCSTRNLLSHFCLGSWWPRSWPLELITHIFRLSSLRQKITTLGWNKYNSSMVEVLALLLPPSLPFYWPGKPQKKEGPEAQPGGCGW